ncbi:hypothetical protein BCV72DRAFT_339863 [Rhizopus microsporus var. microsporus]|uniref:Uncharacterized protein n=1 Tax=Rhizopus microsporus var. microsporus TaxID=86635 RepID=A0A1X0QLY0_RHIZD|nr:hypothetical protein BCV72DRAFT_339863 [Rhizopus microsporus var. microsporus]
MLDKLTTSNQNESKGLSVFGVQTAGLSITLLAADRPTPYITRIIKIKDLSISSDESHFTRSILPLIVLIWQFKQQILKVKEQVLSTQKRNYPKDTSEWLNACLNYDDVAVMPVTSTSTEYVNKRRKNLNDITGINERLPELEVKKLLDLKSYQAYHQTLKNNQSEAEAQGTVEIENGLKQRKKKAPAKVRGAYISYSPEQAQELLGNACLAARDALLEAFHEIGSITLSALHRHLILHAYLTLEKLEPIVSSRTALSNLKPRRNKFLEWKNDENMNWHENLHFH